MTSYFIDTNYFIRLLLRDNEAQFEEVYSLFQQGIEAKAELYTSSVVLFEVYWVLTSFYEADKEKRIKSLETILSLPCLIVENKDVLMSALSIFSEVTLTFEDCYHIAYMQKMGVNLMASFDKKLLKVLKNLDHKSANTAY